MKFIRLIPTLVLFLYSFHICAQVCNSSQIPANLQNGLVAYYPFCGNANDVSGNGNNGTANGATLTTDRFSIPNSAYLFNGSSMISVPNSASLQSMSEISISAWINMYAWYNGTYFPIMHKSNAFFQWGKFAFNINISGLLSHLNGYETGASYGFNLNQWYHVVTVISSGHTKFYVNGVLVSETPSGVFPQTPVESMPLLIGADIPGSPEYAKGTIDDILIYNRALGSCEITQLYNATNAAFPAVGTFPYNSLSDTTRACGTTEVLDAGPGYATYNWNTGATTQTINATTGGFYKVTVTNAAGCSASDSTFLSLVNARILNNDTTICKGSSITLTIDSLFPGRTVCNANQLPANLQNGLVGYWPFCGNANDVSGNGNNGIVTGATLTTDRFGNSNNSYLFNGSDFISINDADVLDLTNNFTISAWFNATSFPPNPFGNPINMILCKRSNVVANITGTYSFGIWDDNGNNKICFQAPPNASAITYPGPNGIISTNNWYLFTATYNDLTKNLKYYLNDTEVYNQTVNFDITNTPYDLTIGSLAPFASYNWNGKLDDIAIYNRVLTSLEVNELYSLSASVLWSTGATTNTITVSPSQTTTYYVTVSDGITSCIDSVKVTVSDIGIFNPLQDTTRVCGTTTLLDAGSGFATYSWNTGATTQTINATTGGFYKVTVTNAAGCSASDSTFLSLVNARILNNDTTICKGSSITLAIDSLFPGRTVCNINELQTNLRNGLVGYWPFCGNANDISGNGNNGAASGANLTTDRFGITGNAYLFNGINSKITVPHSTSLAITGDLTISLWKKSFGHLGGYETYCTKRDALGNWNYSFGGSFYYGPGGCPGEVNKFLTARRNGGGAQYELIFSDSLVTPTDNSWVNVIVKIINNRATFYINGIPTGYSCNSGQFSIPSVDTGAPLTFGSCSCGLSEFFNGVMDDIYIWNRGLSDNEIRQLYSRPVNAIWSNGATTNSITVSPNQTTTYYVTVSDGITSCTDSVKVTVSDLSGYNSLQDTTRVCGTSTLLDAGSGYATYSWNTGATTQTINATTGGFYKVTVTNAAGCSASDSTFLSLVNARILNNDTTICKGSGITLAIDSLFPGKTVCNANQLPANLQNGLVGYWPFCGNANDASATLNNGILNGSVLTTDRFNRPGNAAYFDGIDDRVEIPHNNAYNSGSVSVSLWFNAASFTAYAGYGPHLVSKREESGWGGAFQTNIGIWNNQYSCWADWTIGINGAIIYESPTPIQLGLNKWFHFTYTHDGQFVKLYVNGVNVKTIASPGLLSSNNLPIWIGARPTSGPNRSYFTGKIDDVLLWNRALSQSDVTALYTPAPSVLWSNGAATNTITVNPTQTTTYYVTVSDGITTCTDSVKVTVSAVDTALTVLDPLEVCAVGGQVRLRAGVATTYQWQTSANGTSFTNIAGAISQNYTALATGYYRAIVTNALGCLDSTRVVQVVLNPQPVPSFTVNTNPQCLANNNFTFTNTSTIGSGTMTYLWTFGDGGTATTTNATHVYAAAGTYTVKLVATSNNGCKDSTTQTVLINPSPVAGFTVNNTAQCLNGNNFVFTNTSTISSGTLVYDWTFGDGGSATTANATHVYTNAGTYIVKLVVRSSAGCADSTTQTVTVYPKPAVSFTVNATVQCVNGNNFSFTNTSTVSSGTLSYIWYFGDGGTATTSNATHIYAAAGSYTVKLVALSNNGCTDSTTQTITVNPKPTVDFTINTAAQCMLGNSFIFTNNSTISSGTLQSSWSFGDGGTATTTNATHVYATAGTYTVKLVVRSAAGCADSTTRQVTVYPMPSGTLTAPSSTIICNGSTVTLTATGGDTYQWYLGNIQIPGATSATYDASQPGVYTAELVSSNGCRAMATGSVTLSLVSRPTAAFSFDKYCAGFATRFTNTSAVSNSGIVGYTWNFGDGSTSTLVNPSHIYLQSGSFTITLTATPLACPGLADIKTTTINIAAPPANQRYTTLNAVANRDLQLGARSFTAANYFWTPSIGLSNNFIQSPVFNYDRQQQYLVRINTAEGCVVTDTILVRIFKEREIYVPDVFSPNGDGKNDKLTPLLVGIATLKYFKVFDRWGQLMFSTNLAGAGWDGYFKGAKQPFETYAWIAEGVDIDGNTIKRSGSSILIR